MKASLAASRKILYDLTLKVQSKEAEIMVKKNNVNIINIDSVMLRGAVCKNDTWNTVTKAHNNESKFFRSRTPSLENLHPNRFIPRIL